MTRRFALVVLALAGLTAAGCFCRGSISPPSFSPSAAARQALADYDANKNGMLDPAELENCPSLKASMKSFDADGDGKLTADEIETRLKSYGSNIGLIATSARVVLNDRPVEGMTVTLVPETFLGSSFKRATGVTAGDGTVMFKTEKSKVEGVACGLYRVEVSLTDPGGRETLPAKYNSATTLGCEVSQFQRGNLEFKVVAR